VLVASGVGMLAVAAVVLSLVWAGDALAPVMLVLAGSGLLVGAMDAAGAGASATVPEAVFAGAIGILLARALCAFAGPAVALAVPLFVALVDAWSVAAGPSSRLVQGEPRGAAELTFDLPSWGGTLDGPASRLGLPDAIFLAAFATWAVRLGLRPRATAAGMVCGLLATLAISLATDRAIPALPLLAVGYWLPNLDRLTGLLRAPSSGVGSDDGARGTHARNRG
jgi:hypothetical protein